MTAHELVGAILLALVLLNQRRTIPPLIRDDLRLLQDFLRTTGDARAALWRITLIAALPAYVAWLLASALAAAAFR